jgi:phosphatidylserine/phosphatidylglycerophosphate/cardiolipin synthase-like enzyme
MGWLRDLFARRPAPAPPPTPTPTPTPTPVPPPQPGPSPTPTPGVQVHFTNAYASPLQGLTSEQVRAANQRTAQADPANPDRQLAALIDSIPPGGTLDGAFFSIGMDTVVDALIRAQQRGVRIRLVTERDYHQTPDGVLRPAIARLKAAGISVLPDDRGALMHNKFLIANGQTVWTGSYNITAHGSYEENNNAMRIDAPALAAAYTHEFNKMHDWLNFGLDTPDNGNPLDDHPSTRPIPLANGATVEAYFSPYRAAQAGARGALLDAIRGARQRVEFLAFSFTDDGLGDALAAKAAQGVKVQGVFEKSQAASRVSEYKRLNPLEASLGGNLDVRIDTNPSLMHHKVMIIDDDTLVMGSFNFSQSAQSDNAENMLVFRNAPDLVAAYRAEFRRIQAISVE